MVETGVARSFVVVSGVDVLYDIAGQGKGAGRGDVVAI